MLVVPESGSADDDCVAASRIFEKCGMDLMYLTGGMNGFTRPGHGEPGYFQDMSIPVKQAVGIPVLLTGGATTIAQAESLLADGRTGLVGVGRAVFNLMKTVEDDPMFDKNVRKRNFAISWKATTTL